MTTLVEIQDRWLKGLIEALNEAKIDFKACNNGVREFLEIPKLNMMIGPYIPGVKELMSCPLNGDIWDFSYWASHGYVPIDLGRMIIRKSTKHLSTNTEK